MRDEVPRYNNAHTRQIINMLNLLERGDLPTLQIARNQMEDAIMTVVHIYAKKRDDDDAVKKERHKSWLKSD